MTLRIQGDRALKIPKTARPTASKVRSALFNIWQNLVMDCSWLDVCAGSGAVSAEALLRGARRVVAIEINHHACRILADNLTKAGSAERVQIIRGDAAKVITKLTGTFDLVYFDPPYESNLYFSILSIIDRVCHSSTKVAVEHSSYYSLPAQIGLMTQTDRRVYGQTCLSFFELGG